MRRQSLWTQLSSSNFNAMKQLTSVSAKGSGGIAAILPDTTSSERWAEFDKPDLIAAMKAAGDPVVGHQRPERTGQ